mmetsp:Transcript_145354/g.465735  ORF Transcript_145354/g.465735 Transcript_145354/m.465735 type:complete len:95 (+) Transcript_145354:2028-2312(+)
MFTLDGDPRLESVDIVDGRLIIRGLLVGDAVPLRTSTPSSFTVGGSIAHSDVDGGVIASDQQPCWCGWQRFTRCQCLGSPPDITGCQAPNAKVP